MQKRVFIYIIYAVSILTLLVQCSPAPQKVADTMTRQAFIEDLKMRTFNYFWKLVDTVTYQIPDRYPTEQFASIAATGFGLATYIVGINNKYITREEGAQRTLATLEWLYNAKQGDAPSGTTGYKGFFYHFLTNKQGTRFKNVELSTIDTGLLMAGILTSQSYFDADNSTEAKIRALADSLFLRVEWDWAMNGRELMSMGWHPESGFLESEWGGYNEAMVLVIMALGSTSHPIHDSAWAAWCKGYDWANFKGYEHVNFDPLFGHQYSHMFIDFKGITDDYMKQKGMDYFENSRRATLSNRAYCIENPRKFKDYDSSIWGLTACDGPADVKQLVGKDSVLFFSYRARGAAVQQIVDDGTIAPTAAGGSVPFAPEECLSALYQMYLKYGDTLYADYGFKDAFNPTYTDPKTGKQGWFDIDYLGIDQGPIAIQLENYQTQLIWNTLKKNKYIIKGLQRAGFSGGWLDKVANK